MWVGVLYNRPLNIADNDEVQESCLLYPGAHSNWTKPLNDDLFVTVPRSSKLVNRTAYGSKVSARHVINFLSVPLKHFEKES